jgi:hypothetical protein
MKALEGSQMYSSLHQLILPHLEKACGELPADVKARVNEEFFPHPWDSLAPSQRSALAQQYDTQRDPAMAEENQYWFDLQCEIDEGERQIGEWEAMGHQGIPSEARIKDEKLSTLRLALAALSRRWEQPFSSKASPATKEAVAQPSLPVGHSLPSGTREGPRAYASLHELVQPYVEESYDNLPPEVQGQVVKYFTPESWNDSSPAGRANVFRRHDEQVDTDRAEIDQTMAIHAYWFGLQSEILATERKIANLRSIVANSTGEGDSEDAKLTSLQIQLAVLHEKWRLPDDLAAKSQLAAEKAILGPIPAVFDISRAIQFFTENTSATWTAPHLLSLVSNSDICPYAAVSPWTPMYIVVGGPERMRKLPFVKPGRSVLVKMAPAQVEEVWVSGKTESSTWVSTEPFSVDTTDYVYLESPVTLSCSDIRLTKAMLLQILKKWETSRHPIAPLPAPNAAAALLSGALADAVEQSSHLDHEITEGTPAQLIERTPRESPEWVTSARVVAEQYIARHKKSNLYPSLKDVCAHVETQLRVKRSFGAHGRPLSATYIGRNALQGEWWRANKP